MVRSSSCKNVDAVCFLNRFDNSWVYHYLTRFIGVGLDEFTHDSWLLIDFLEHVVWVSPLISRVFIHVHGEGIPLLFVPGKVLDGNVIRLNNH